MNDVQASQWAEKIAITWSDGKWQRSKMDFWRAALVDYDEAVVAQAYGRVKNDQPERTPTWAVFEATIRGYRPDVRNHPEDDCHACSNSGWVEGPPIEISCPGREVDWRLSSTEPRIGRPEKVRYSTVQPCRHCPAGDRVKAAMAKHAAVRAHA